MQRLERGKRDEKGGEKRSVGTNGNKLHHEKAAHAVDTTHGTNLDKSLRA